MKEGHGAEFVGRTRSFYVPSSIDSLATGDGFNLYLLPRGQEGHSKGSTL